MNGWDSFARMFIMFGLIFLIIGGVMLIGGKIGIGRLPGDIIIKKGNFSFYFPVATSILLSIILSLFFYLFRR